jgi:activator of 2-hydroxyglutaryl-CoA dehydratase
MISQLVAGYTREEVIAGMHYAFARRISFMIPEAQELVLIGGTVKNTGMLSALKDILQKEVLVPDEPQIVNALGALKFYF